MSIFIYVYPLIFDVVTQNNIYSKQMAVDRNAVIKWLWSID